MSAKPILFSAPMVRALLDGTKTQTRRVVKPQPPHESENAIYNPSHFEPDRGWYWSPNGGFMKCPYGHIGDLTWVRETIGEFSDPTGAEGRYVADGSHAFTMSEWPWKRPVLPSIHMPRWASRLTLRITDVRVERVQDISEEDAKAEGAERIHFRDAFNIPETFMRQGSFPIYSEAYGFQHLWDSINAAPKPIRRDGTIVAYESYPWDDTQETREHRGLPWYVHGNPWVWALSFEIIHQNVDAVGG